MIADQYVVPAPATTIAGPSAPPSGGVYYERLAPGGGHYPAEYIPNPGQMAASMPAGMASSAMHFHPQASTSGYAPMPMPPLPTGGYAPPGYAPPGYAPMQYAAGHQMQNTHQPQPQQPHQHSVMTGHEWPPQYAGEVKHAPKEADGKVPYELPRPYANELGFPKLEETKQLYPQPTFKRAEVEGDVIEIEASGPSRWELELQDAAWDKPVLAVVDSGQKKATFRLDNAIVKKPDGRKYVDGKFVWPAPAADAP